MEEKYFVWDDVYEGLTTTKYSKVEDEKKISKSKESKIPKSKIYFPHECLNIPFKETLNYNEQTKFQKEYQRKAALRQMTSDVVLLQDIKDLTFYTVDAAISTEFIGFVHLPIVDRFLRALILYMQHYLTTWSELKLKREAAAKRIANPLAGGARVVRSQEMRVLRCLLGREYSDLLSGCQKEARKYHHAGGGEISFTKSRGEKDLRIFEGLIRFAHRVTWVALGRKQKDLIELEIHRLFRTEGYNIAGRKYAEVGSDWQVPEDEHWILYGTKMPYKRKIIRNSPLIYELLNTYCDYRILSLGLSNEKSRDPRIIFFENALVAKEEDLSRIGIKVGILGMRRTDFDIMLTRQTSEDDQVVIEETPIEDDEEDDYTSLIPLYGSDLELNKLFSMEKFLPQYSGDDKIRNDCKKKWILRELKRAASNFTDTKSLSNTLNE